MNKLLPIAVAFGIFSGNSNAASTQAKLDLLTAATLYPEETRAMLKRRADDARALQWGRIIFYGAFWFGIFLLLKYGT